MAKKAKSGAAEKNKSTAVKKNAKKAGKKQSTIPAGYQTITPYLIVKGAAAAIDFYKEAFNAREITRVLAVDGISIAHAELKIGNSIVLLSDEMPAHSIYSPQSLGGTPVAMHLYLENVEADWQRILDAGAHEIAPLSNSYWGDLIGKVIDPYGHVWSLATRVENLTPDEIAERAASLLGANDEHDTVAETTVL